MNSIRSIIKNIILEAMYNPSSVSGKFAIWTDWFDGSVSPEFNFVMYDWSHAEERIAEQYNNGEEIDIEDAISGENENGYSAIAAVIRIERDPYSQGCNGAWEVTRSAAEGGFGPTLYDMVMSISPNGITSDRRSVSRSARKVWDFYAHNRPEIEKRFLDGANLTSTKEDDCRTFTRKKKGSLYHLTRIMAINFAKENYPLAYDLWEKNIPMDIVIAAGDMNGDDWIDQFESGVWDLVEEEPDWEDSLFHAGESIEELEHRWSDYKLKNESDLMSMKKGDFKTDDEFLDLSYNTQYAIDSFHEMLKNHSDFLNSISDDGSEGGADAVNDFIINDIPQTAVGDYFTKKYNR